MKEEVILGIREENKTLKMSKAREEIQGMCCCGCGILQRDVTEAVGRLGAQRVAADVALGFQHWLTEWGLWDAESQWVAQGHRQRMKRQDRSSGLEDC